MMYNPYGKGGVPQNIFCLKADYVESSHANNTGVAKFINDCLYDTKTPPQLENPSLRTTINGFPIELYVNGEYLGVYNFNYDRYSYKPYGYDYVKYPNVLSYEVNSNSNTSAGVTQCSLYQVIGIANLFNCWKFLKLSKLQRNSKGKRESFKN